MLYEHIYNINNTVQQKVILSMWQIYQLLFETKIFQLSFL